MRPAAVRVGLFALAALGVLVAAVLLASGRWFAPTEKVQMRFEGSVFGLQVGAPVVLRGVRVGQVSTIGLAMTNAQGARQGLAVPVVAELDRSLLAGLAPPTQGAETSVVPLLVAQGLTATLASQSLLTGLLYVDLDFARPAGAVAPRAAHDGTLTEIPTRQAPLAALQSQLEGLDIAQVGRDVAAVAAALRRITDEPGATQALARASAAAQSLQALATRLERELPPMIGSARQALEASRVAVDRLAPAAERAAGEVATAAAATAAAASAARGTASSAEAALQSVRRAANELGAAAAQLRAVTADGSPMSQDATHALRDVSGAARALRELAESLERQPDALLRGRGATPD